MSEIKKLWQIIPVGAESVLELRALPPAGLGAQLFPKTKHFRHKDYGSVAKLTGAFETEALSLNDAGYNIYIVMNPIKPDFVPGSRKGVTDADIDYRNLMLIDIDRAGDTKNPATGEELSEAVLVAERIADFVRQKGWGEPLRVMSGNGQHLYLGLKDVDNSAESKRAVESALKGLAARFDTEGAKVDTTVFNASRITKVPGTLMRKGIETPVRPYRVATVLPVGGGALKNDVTLEMLNDLARVLEPSGEKLDMGLNAVVVAPKILTALAVALTGRPMETPSEIAKLDQALSVLTADVGRGTGSFYDGAGAPVLDYRLAVIWAIHSLGWSCGKEKARQWAQQAQDRYDDARFEKAWKSYNPNHARPVSIGSLYKRAAEITRSNAETLALTGVVVNEGAVTYPAVSEFGSTDAGNAQKLQILLGGGIAWVHEQKQWLLFNERSGWTSVTNEHMIGIAIRVAKDLLSEAATAHTIRDVKVLMAHATRSLSKTALMAAVELLKSQAGVEVRINQLDSNGMLLGLPGGTVIDLRTGALRAQTPEDYITKSAGCISDPTAKCPTFLAFLNSIFVRKDSGQEGAVPEVDKDLIDYLQRWVGYALTGRTDEQMFLFAHGHGANGKSVLFNVLGSLLGDYAMHSQVEAFMAADRGGGKSDLLARLKGARLVIAPETEDGQRLAESTIKQLTGGDTITAAHKYGHAFDFKPEFKLAMVGNHKPVIRGDDQGIWRRVQLLPFTRTFTPDQQDKELPAKLKSELPGILKWAIQGALMWQKSGLNIPKVMQDEVNAYRSEMDVIGQWIEERCDPTPEGKELSANLYASYRGWCMSNGCMPTSARRFSQKLEERGFKRSRGTGGVTQRKGLTLRQIPLSLRGFGLT